VFDIVVTVVVMVWKKYFIKNAFSWGWFDIYVCLVEIVVEIKVEQKII